MPEEENLSPTGVEKSLVEQFRAIEAELTAKESTDGADSKDGAAAKDAAPEQSAKSDDKATDGEPAESAEGEDAKADGDDKAKDEAKKDDDDKPKGKPLPGERAQFRAEKRRWKEQAAAREAQLAERERALVEKEKAGGLTPERLKELDDAGDVDEIAKLAGHKSWNDWVAAEARRVASPEYKRQRALETEVAEMKRQREEEAKRNEEQRRKQEQVATRERNVKGFREALKKWDDPVVAKLAGADDDFAVIIYDRVASQFAATDRPSEEELVEATQEAIDELRERVQKRRALWNEAFGDQATVTPEAATAATPSRAGSKQPASASKHVSKAKATEASAAPAELSDKEWMALAQKEMRKAYAEDTTLKR